MPSFSKAIGQVDVNFCFSLMLFCLTLESIVTQRLDKSETFWLESNRN